MSTKFIPWLLGIMLYSIMLVGCSMMKKDGVPGSEPTPEQQEKKIQLQRDKEYIQIKRDDATIYLGEGIFNIAGDIGNAKEEAKKRALRALSQNIEVRVESDFEGVVTDLQVHTLEGISETIREEIRDRIHTYTNQVIHDIDERWFPNVPQDDNLTYLVWISRSDYEEKVKNDLNNKKAGVLTSIRNGDIEYERGNYISALANWIYTRMLMKQYFGVGVPVQDDADGDGLSEELNAYLEGKVTHFVSNLEIHFPNSCSYDVQGNLTLTGNEKLEVYLALSQEGAISGIPLKVEFERGAGSLDSQSVRTNSSGKAELPIRSIDPTYREVNICISVDAEQIPGLEEVFDLPSIPRACTSIERIQTIAYSIRLEKIDDLSPWEDEIHSIITGKELASVPFSIGNQTSIEEILGNVQSTHADYFLFIEGRTSGGTESGDFSDIYSANCSGSVKIFRIDSRMNLASEPIPEKRGMGISPRAAEEEGYRKMKQDILGKVRAVITDRVQ
jgi:hypothetical protein